MNEAMMSTPLGLLPVNSEGMRQVVDALAAVPMCACGDGFTAEAMCVNCAIGTPTDLQVAREANFKLVKEVERLKGKAMRQRKELRRLNKVLGPYWQGFRLGQNVDREHRLREIMIAAFGYRPVLEAEHAAVDKAAAEEKV